MLRPSQPPPYSKTRATLQKFEFTSLQHGRPLMLQPQSMVEDITTGIQLQGSSNLLVFGSFVTFSSQNPMFLGVIDPHKDTLLGDPLMIDCTFSIYIQAGPLANHVVVAYSYMASGAMQTNLFFHNMSEPLPSTAPSRTISQNAFVSGLTADSNGNILLITRNAVNQSVTVILQIVYDTASRQFKVVDEMVIPAHWGLVNYLQPIFAFNTQSNGELNTVAAIVRTAYSGAGVLSGIIQIFYT